MVKKKKEATVKHFSFKGKERWYLAGIMIVLVVALFLAIFASSQFSATGEAKRGLSLKKAITCS